MKLAKYASLHAKMMESASKGNVRVPRYSVAVIAPK